RDRRETTLYRGTLPEASSAALAAQLLGRDTRPSEATQRTFASSIQIPICNSTGGVERWGGGLGGAYPLPALSSAGASLATPCDRFHLPLIKPDRRISRIRLSDKDSCCGPRNVTVAQAELSEPQRRVQVGIGEVAIAPPLLLVFTT